MALTNRDKIMHANLYLDRLEVEIMDTIRIGSGDKSVALIEEREKMRVRLYELSQNEN